MDWKTGDRETVLFARTVVYTYQAVLAAIIVNGFRVMWEVSVV